MSSRRVNAGGKQSGAGRWHSEEEEEDKERGIERETERVSQWVEKVHKRPSVPSSNTPSLLLQRGKNICLQKDDGVARRFLSID